MPDLPIAGLHGAERRDSNGDVQRIGFNDERLLRMEHVLEDVVNANPGMLLEIKGAALALHYRNAPDREPAARAATERLVARIRRCLRAAARQDGLRDQAEGRRQRARRARVPDEPPFAGRKPVFVGDDLTDEKGFAVVNEFDGVSIKVGAGDTLAHARIDSVGALLDVARSIPAWRESRFVSRLIIVSNRVAPISEGGPAAGGLAVGVYDALKETGGMWFGWSGDVLSAPPDGIKLEERGR